jgi:hypothetical protein
MGWTPRPKPCGTPPKTRHPVPRRTVSSKRRSLTGLVSRRKSQRVHNDRKPVRAMATNQELRVVEAPKAAQTEPGHAMLLNISTYVVVVAFAALWFEFFRNLAALPKALMFWHFHF